MSELGVVLLFAFFILMCTKWSWPVFKFVFKTFFTFVWLLCIVGFSTVIVNSPWAYHTFGQTPFGYLRDRPNYFKLKPGDPDPMSPGVYMPGAPHAPVPDMYYDRLWWPRPSGHSTHRSSAHPNTPHNTQVKIYPARYATYTEYARQGAPSDNL